MKKQKQLDWNPFLYACGDALDCALDIAAQGAGDEDSDPIDRVRAFVHRRVAGLPARLSIKDALVAFGHVLGAIERELGAVHIPSFDELWMRLPRHLVLSVRPRNPVQA